MRRCLAVFSALVFCALSSSQLWAQANENRIVGGFIARPARLIQSEVFTVLSSHIEDKSLVTDLGNDIHERLGIPIQDIESVMVLFDRDNIFLGAGLDIPKSGSANVETETFSKRTLTNNLKMIGLAMHNHYDVYREFPNVDGREGSRGNLSWRVHILPFLEQNDLYQQFNLDEPWDSEHNKALISKMPDVFKVSSGDPAGHTRVRVLTGGDGNVVTPFGNRGKATFRNIIDGTSNTLMTVVAGSDQTTEWTKPVALELQQGQPAATLGKIGPKFIAGLCDGWVTEYSRDMAAERFWALATQNGGEVVDGYEQNSGRSNANPIVVLTTNKPMDQAVVSKSIGAGEQIEVIFSSPNRLIACPSDYADTVTGLLEESEDSIVGKLKDLSESNDIAAVADLKSVKPALLQLSKEAPGGSIATSIKEFVAQISVTQSGQYLERVEISAANDRAADQIQAIARGLLQVQNAAVANLGYGENPLPAGTLKAVQKLLDTTTIQSDGSRVVYSIRRPENFVDDIDRLGSQINKLAGFVKKQRESARRLQRMNSLKMIALGMHNYHDVYQRFPRADGDAEGLKTGLSWRVHLLPFLDEVSLYEEFNFDEPWDSEHNKVLVEKMPDVFLVEGIPNGQTSIHLFGGLGPWQKREKGPRIRDFIDGTSNTIMTIVAGKETATPWTKPGALQFDGSNALDVIGDADDKILFGLTDGSVRRVDRSKLSESLMKKLIQHNDGQIIGDF